AFERYCDRVQSTAEWGGQPEIRALTEVLKRPVEIYRAAEKKPMVMTGGAEGGSEPLRVSYHLKYYALGEHYNSVVPMGDAAEEEDEDGEGADQEAGAGGEEE
ncbi:otud6b, partial [Symbiodinium sp. KB8]